MPTLPTLLEGFWRLLGVWLSPLAQEEVSDPIP